jgi:hypothetical protein
LTNWGFGPEPVMFEVTLHGKLPFITLLTG